MVKWNGSLEQDPRCTQGRQELSWKRKIVPVMPVIIALIVLPKLVFEQNPSPSLEINTTKAIGTALVLLVIYGISDRIFNGSRR